MQKMDGHTGDWQDLCITVLQWTENNLMFLFGTVKWQLVFLLQQNSIFLTYINWVTASISLFQCSKKFIAIAD